MSNSNQTHDHSKIKNWVEERNGVPARIKGTGKSDADGLLRIHFPDNSDSDDFEEMDWEDFFRDFDDNKLDFLFQEEKANGEKSTFHKFIERS